MVSSNRIKRKEGLIHRLIDGFKARFSFSSMNVNLTALWVGFILFCFLSFFVLDGIRERMHDSYLQKFPHTQLAIQSKLHVLSIWQWLTDISATRGRDGLDKGFLNAEIHKEKFLKDIQILKEKLDEIGDAEGLIHIENLIKNFEIFYIYGQKMAHAYVLDGPQAGNRLMGNFDKTAEAMLGGLDQIVIHNDRQLSDSLFSIHDSMHLIIIYTLITNALGLMILWLVTKTIRKTHAALKTSNTRLNQEVSNIKIAEEALRRSEAFKSTILHSLSEGIVTLDDQGRILKLNPAMKKIFGYSNEEVDGKSLVELFLPTEIRDRNTEKLIQCMESGQPPPSGSRFEVPAITKDGSVIAIEMNVNDIQFDDQNYFTLFIRDITDRKMAEKEIHRLATSIEQIAEGIVITDSERFIQYVNPAFEYISGFSLDEVLGKRQSLLFNQKQDEAFYNLIWQTIRSGEVWQGLITNRKKDGGYYEEEMTISPIRNEEGEIINFVFVQRDVTREREMEAQLSQSQKMEAIGVLAGGIAHDFNNILTPILGHSELAKMDLDPESKIFRDLEVIERGALRAKDLVAQILLFSRRTKGEKKPVQMVSLVKEVFKLMRSALPKTIVLRENIDPKLHRVLADPIQIHSLVMNLFTNAKHAMPKGGVIKVSLSNEVLEDHEISPGKSISGNFVSLKVRDTGTGIGEDILPRIFEPFFTTKDVSEGTGLGLSTVFGIIERHNGYISVSSEVGQGTVFQVFFPALQEEKQELAKPTTALELYGQESILFVDDEEDIVRLGKISLEKLGFRVTGSTSPQAALELFSSKPSDFDLVVTDQAMPVMTGEVLTNNLRLFSPTIPIIFMTGDFDNLIDERMEVLGIDEVLSKPFTQVELGQMVRKILDAHSKDPLRVLN